MAYLDTPNFMNPDPGLENITALLKELGDPQDKLHFVHIAGTNGKGSTAAFLERILRESGYKTGMYTSPYLIHFSEKIQVSGREITEDEIISLTEKIRQAEEKIKKEKNLFPTVFERVTALAFQFFYEQGCDIVVLETGLGGRLDATNVIKNTEAAVITAIGLDHTDILGDTKVKIAGEKAGIIKHGCDVILYEQDEEVMEKIARVCRKMQADLYIAAVSQGKMGSMTPKGQSFSYGKYKDLHTGMLGIYQMHNAITALCTAERLKERWVKIDEDSIRRGLEKARWIGRLELLKEDHMFLVDAAHNPQGVSALAESLQMLIPDVKKSFVIGVLSDKDYETMIDIISPQAKSFYVVTPHSTRALDGERLADILKKRGFKAESFSSVSEAVAAAEADGRGDKNAVICAFGSLYYIGDVIACLEKEREDGYD